MMDALLAETATRILARLGDRPETLWTALEENGLTRSWVGEAQGGFGLSAVDGFGLIRLAGYYAAPVPLAETLIASWFLSEAGLLPPEGPLSFIIHGWQRHVPFGAMADHIVCVDRQTVRLHRGGLSGTVNGIGPDPVAPLHEWPDKPLAQGQMAATDALSFAALVRAVQICGALDAVLDLTIPFAEQREQFGRSLSKFQAIQHLLSEMGAEAAAASAAADFAVMQVRRGEALDLLHAGTAKYRAGLAAEIVAEHAHQVHGAIGYTEEYGLARLTRRLWHWREDCGGEAWWSGELGRAALEGDKPLWPRLTKGALR